MLGTFLVLWKFLKMIIHCTLITRFMLFRPYFDEKLDSSTHPVHETPLHDHNFLTLLLVFLI